MGGFLKVNAERVETTALNTKVNKELFDDFKIALKRRGYPMNVVLETFMQQYANGNFEIDSKDIKKWNRNYSNATLNTTFNKKIYVNFKHTCKSGGHFVNSVLMAFMVIYASGTLEMEFVKTKENKEE